MSTATFDTPVVRRILENPDLKIVLDSPNKDYRFEYFTTTIKDRQTDALQLVRTYRLIDLTRGGITPEPWDSYDLDQQTTLLSNLIRFSGYQVVKIVSGWQATCPTCGHISQGKNWETPDRTCVRDLPAKCRSKITDESIEELLFRMDVSSTG